MCEQVKRLGELLITTCNLSSLCTVQTVVDTDICRSVRLPNCSLKMKCSAFSDSSGNKLFVLLELRP